MKKLVFAAISLFVFSSHAMMGDYETRITCSETEAGKIVSDLVASGTSGKALKNDLNELLTNKIVRSESNPADIKIKIKQAACIKALVTPETYASVINGSYSDQLELISLRLRINANNSPMVDQNDAQKNSSIADALIETNKTTIAFIFGLF
jgi:hypothetical protein